MKRQPSVQDVTWFLDLNRLEQLNLDPPYQRKSVWSPKDRRFFLDTILRNYPCPPIFLNKEIDDNGKTTYHVVDGKQRLETIILFANNKIALDKEFGDDRFNGKKFRQLAVEEKRKFWNYSLPVDYIILTPGLDINEVFDRVNRNSRNLEPQELRHAKFTGWFITEAESEADDNRFWESIKVTTKGKSKRMKNVQLVSELLMVIIQKSISGFSQENIDNIYAMYDDIEEDDLEFEVEGYNEKKIAIIETLEAIESHNQSITTFSTTANNLYSLWSLIALAKPNKSDTEIADSYRDFMRRVQEIKSLSDPEQFLNQSSSDEDRLSFEYYNNSRGASTDFLQRKGRHEALIEWFNR